MNPTFVADVDGTYVAQLIVGDGVLLSNPDTVTITAAPGADLAVSFYQAASNPAVGSNFEWGISVNNLGPANTSDVRVRAAFPAGYTFTAKNVPVGSYDEATGIWTIGPMLASATVNLAIFATVNATGPYDLTATIIESSAPDPNLANNTGTHIVTPNGSADLAISFFAAASNPPVGSNTGWGITVTNLGPANTTNVRIRAAFPAGYTFTAKSLSSGSYDEATGIWTIGSMGFSSSANLSLFGTVNVTGPYDLTASVIESSAPDPNPANNTRTDLVTANANADLAISFYAAASNPPVGSNAGWGISVQNLGPATTTNVRVRAAFPAGYTFTAKSLSFGSYDEATGIWTLGPMASSFTANLGICRDGERHWSI